MSCEECLGMEFSHNSEKKELEEQILGLQKKLKDSVSRETKIGKMLNKEIEEHKLALKKIDMLVIYKEGYSNIIDDLESKNYKIGSFIRLLDEKPMFWGISYKKSIKDFLYDNQYSTDNKYNITLDFNYLDE